MSEIELPEGWNAVALADVVTPYAPIQYGILQPGPDTPGGVPYVRPTEIKDDRIDEASLRRTTRQIADKYRRSSLRAGDVVLSIVGSIGKVAAVPPALEGANITQSSARLRPRPELVSTGFLAWFLRSPVARKQFDAVELGTGVPRLNIGDIRQFEIPLPPLAEQQRIVAKVEELLAPVNAARERLAGVPAVLNRFRKAVLAAACEGRLTEGWRRARAKTADLQGDDRPLPVGWRRTSLGSVSARITKGSTPTSYGHQFQTAGISFVKVENIRHGRIDRASIKDFITKEAHRSQERSILEAGDVLFSIAGTIGATCVVEADDLPANTNQALAIIRGTSKSLVPRFLQIALEVASTAAIDDSARGVGMNNISLADVRDFEIPMPPLSEQPEIVKRVAALFNFADTIEKRVAAATARAEKLTRAILAKAFRGELVPTEAELARRDGQRYETAETLMKTINADKTAGPAPRRSASRGEK